MLLATSALHKDQDKILNHMNIWNLINGIKHEDPYYGTLRELLLNDDGNFETTYLNFIQVLLKLVGVKSRDIAYFSFLVQVFSQEEMQGGLLDSLLYRSVTILEHYASQTGATN